MKKLYLCFPLLLVFFLPGFGQTSGGPDAFGYVWRDSNDSLGPTYSWVDITSSGTRIMGLADDNSVPFISMGFNFAYYWGTFDQVKVGSNGWLSFNNTSNIAHCFPTIPAAGGQSDNYVAPYMADLNFTGTGNQGQAYYWGNNTDSFIVSYINVPLWVNANPPYAGSNTFQVIFSGVDSSITFQYLSMDTSFNDVVGCLADNEVGIENITGNIGLEVYNEQIPPSQYAIKFYYPDSVLISIQDVTPAWNLNTGNAGEFKPQGAVALGTNIANAGNAAVTAATSVAATVRDLANINQYSSSASVSSLGIGADTTIIFSPNATLNTPGQYYYDVTTTNSQDINSTNNTQSAELVIVNLNNPTATLSYATGGASTGTLSWSGGDTTDGGGVFIEPPIYPVTITSVQYYISTAVPTNGYKAAIFDDNGIGGAPGTQLYAQWIAPGGVVGNSWNTVTLSSPVTITSGGFYVGWFQGGAGITLGTETNGPISQRTFEVLNNAWAEYRSGTTTDILIRATITGYPCGPGTGFSFNATSNTVAFANTTSNATSYTWTFGDGTSSTQVSPTHTYTIPGTYTVCLIATNSCGSDTLCQTVNACVNPVAGFSFNNGANNSVSFTDTTSGTPSAWLWDFGDGNFSSLQNPMHNYSSSGTYTVCLISTNACGMDTTCTQVVVCPTPAAFFSNSVSSNVATFTDGSTNATSWLWDFGDGNTSTMQNPTHTYAQNGTYTVCLISTNSCGSDSTCQILSICKLPVSSFTFQDNQLTVSFTDGSSDATSWSWDFGDGNTSTMQSPSHTYTQNGTYTICLIATNSCGTDTSCRTVTVLGTGLKPSVFNGPLEVFPNPGSGLFNVRQAFLESGEIEIRVYSVVGKQLFRSSEFIVRNVLTTQVDLSHLASGIYMLEVSKGAQKVYRRLVIE